MHDTISADVYNTTQACFPSDGKGGIVIANAAGISVAGTTSFTSTTAVDTAFNTATTPAAPNGIARGCLITTADGYYALIDSFVSGAGGTLTVKRWLHKDPSKCGGVPAGPTWTVWTQPLPAGGSKFCIIGNALEIELYSLLPLKEITAAHTLDLVDASGALILPTPFRFNLGSDAGQFRWPAPRKFCGLVGFKMDNATELGVAATMRVKNYSTSRSPTQLVT